MRGLLDSLLDYAGDVDTALEVAGALGWRLYLVNGPDRAGSQFFVMLAGPEGPVLNQWATVNVATRIRFANATYHSLYGAVLLALLRGLVRERQCVAEVDAFNGSRQSKKAAA